MGEAPREPGNAFGVGHTPPPDLIDDCVHCGFCLPACPTYVLWGQEMDSPRGRLYLMKMGIEGEASLTPAFVAHFDRCLGCMACMTACPSGVDYGKLIESARARIEEGYKRPLSDRLLRRTIFELFPRPGRLRLVAVGLWLYEASGLRSLLGRLGLLGLLPPRLRAMEGLLPRLRWRSFRGSPPLLTKAEGERRQRVGLLLGCVQRVFFPGVNGATARVLAAEGCDVVAPPEPECCGALMLHAGLEAEAAAAARRTVDVFEGLGVDAIVTNAAGCGSCLKEYPWLLRDEPAYAERAKAFAARCRDVSEVLAGLAPRGARHPLPIRAAYQDACHLQHAQGCQKAPREILGRIPGLEIVEIGESVLCCGSAGVYSLLEPSAAQALGARKVERILETGPDVVATGNPGCLLQLRRALARAGRDVPVVHTVELLDASLRGVGVGDLLRR